MQDKLETAATVPADVPAAPTFNPVASGIEKASKAGDEGIATLLKAFASMPPATSIIANPVLFDQPVECRRLAVDLRVRAFSIRGLLTEWEIVGQKIPPEVVVFVGLFGRLPDPKSEIEHFTTWLSETFYRAIGRLSKYSEVRNSVVSQVVEFVHRYPKAEPSAALQYFSALRKAQDYQEGRALHVDADRDNRELLGELVTRHFLNVAVAHIAAFAARRFEEHPTASAGTVSEEAWQLVGNHGGAGPFEASYRLLLGREALPHETRILERLGTIQIHHGSAGSNMVARYLATLHAESVEDLLMAAFLALDSSRHFGAIHKMSEFVSALEPLSPAARDTEVRRKIVHGGLPTFGHPEIAAAGRSQEIEQDPRPAIYLEPVFEAIDSGRLRLSSRQAERLSIAQRIYQIAFSEGVVKSNAPGAEPLRLTPNTDYGAWCVQEALGIREPDRTLLTLTFRGFGWMMDVREQLQQPIIRPVIPPDPKIVPVRRDVVDTSIPRIVKAMHDRLERGAGFSKT